MLYPFWMHPHRSSQSKYHRKDPNSWAGGEPVDMRLFWVIEAATLLLALILLVALWVMRAAG